MKRTLLILFTILSFSSCDDEKTSIDYPATGFYGDNILLIEKTEYTNRENSLQCKIPKGKKVKIIITGKTVSTVGAIPMMTGIWYLDPTTTNNWAVTNFDKSTNNQSFSSIDGGLTCDVKMMFDTGTFQIDYYENNSMTPTLTKTISVAY